MLQVFAIDNHEEISILIVHKRKSGDAIDQFWSDGISVQEIDWKNARYKSETSAYSSFRSMIKKLGFGTIRVTKRKEHVYLVNPFFI